MASTKFTSSQTTITNQDVLDFLAGIGISGVFVETTISQDQTKLIGLVVDTMLTQQQKNAITAQYPDLVAS